MIIYAYNEGIATTTTQNVTKADLLFHNQNWHFSPQFSLYWEHTTTTQNVTKADLLFHNQNWHFSPQFSLYWEHQLDMELLPHHFQLRD